ncbi:AAA family ATPase [Cyanobium sp. LEGE 06113]|uniref:AAA family ATPase n=1 Tax=Cyanobium sp. LEGE 06113 TaxID=1297573 RepID=UPI00187EBD44|nr:AAA family ATPase [Cyanobium sp. LEGE 06113]MBE9152867.1 ATP-binding protein [Cyanobium sp. LEGE 06113]MBE9152928.1 ATP-binding protein [Cyanobium sp. LEGE 06113]
MSFQIEVPTQEGVETLQIEVGSSVVIVGANGSGKTRLASYVEDQLGERSHRIAAHRALSLNPSVAKVSEREARLGLRTGYSGEGANINYRKNHRWKGGSAPVALLNDFDFLLQSLFAEQTNTSLETHKSLRAGGTIDAKATRFEILKQVWESLLTHKELHISGDDIQVSTRGNNSLYSASEMSDGERAVFYMLGQSLVAEPSSLLIFDEPELHVHKSIMSKLWDELESIRPDCGFMFITHDIDFACSRIAEKYVIQAYLPTPSWEISPIPKDSGFDETITTLILGSRKPILFVEGNANSLDIATYRRSYPEWTVIPRGSCEQVIHSVVTLRENSELTRVFCAGIVDSDDYSENDSEHLSTLGIQMLPVSEIENIFVHPSVARAILLAEGFTGKPLEDKLQEFCDAIIASLSVENIERSVLRFCRRRIDRALKKVDLSDARTPSQLDDLLRQEISNLNFEQLSAYAQSEINQSKAAKDLVKLLSIYDNKGMLAIASSHLRGTRRSEFEHWLIRLLNNQASPPVIEEIKRLLPRIDPPPEILPST